jgi:4-hydroxy-2-oxovalerate aldolase
MSPERPIILDCTIRDGSYAIDFKFTADDTALIAGLLDEAGIAYVEIGHGLGLGASEAGKGRAGSHDLEVIRATRSRVVNAKIGAFFIPGVGTEGDLRAAADAGLDFVRVGYDADAIEKVWPYLELGRQLGLEVFVNFMKTYGIPPSQFAESSAAAGERGAAGVYVVDSAGGMLPDEVAAYVSETRARTDVPVGFHGHDNLHLAVANSIAAWRAGAQFIDTSVFGIGRSSGNVPTEVMAAVFDRLGVDCGVDALAIIDLAESYLSPLAEHLHPHTMEGVSLGYGRFHSGFLPKALEAATAADVNPFRLIVALGQKDMMRMPADMLAKTVDELSSQAPPEARGDLARFSDTRFGPRRISNRPQALLELVDGLEVVAAKRHLDVVLDLVPTRALDEEATAAEFVIEDDRMALGRLRYGSLDAARVALAEVASRISLGLLDAAPLDRDSVVPEARALAALVAGVVVYRTPALELEYLGDVALARLPERIVLADPGSYGAADVDLLVARLAAVAPVTRVGTEVPEAAGALVVVAGPAGAVSGPGVENAIFIGARVEPPAGATALLREDAYRDTLPRWQRALASSPVGVLA